VAHPTASAERIVATQGQGSPIGYYIAGVVMAIVGMLMVHRAFRHAGAVSAIDVAGDGGWTLLSRFGRTLGVVRGDETRSLELTCETIILWSSAVPKRQDLSSGVLVVGERRWKLATSGPDAYDRALGELGYQARAPRPGESLTL
jgi:hypothetical protein